ncbi:S8 family serine peptidase [Roseivirga sp. BDSF3-8]|uniref:S8 family peptidase n=1 Tax=Roseivirga sp. BDSF3-8 TaxID=3241598 RepID=UPI00353224E1
MKPHLVIQFDKPLEGMLPSWQAFVSDKSVVCDRTGTPIDGVMRKYAQDVFVTLEYTPKAGEWSDEEIAAGLNRYYRIILRDTTQIPDGLINDIRLHSDVISVRPPGFFSTSLRPFSYPSTTMSRRLRHEMLNHLDPDLQGSRNITIAVLDTGVNAQHPELDHTGGGGFDFVDILDGADAFVGDYLGPDAEPSDEVGHGTHVAGIIAGKGRSMPPGIAPRCKILPVRVLGAFQNEDGVVGAGLLENIDAGIKYAIDQGAEIINMSLGIRHEGGGLPHEEVIRYARSKGTTIVAAAGNDGRNQKYYPGANPYVIAVGAGGEEEDVAGFSTYGAHVSVVAPGTNIYSSYGTDEYAYSSGTSQAAPFVSGCLAILKTAAAHKGVTLSDNQMKYLIKHTSDKVSNRIKDIKAGYGHINIQDALRLLNYKIRH